MENSDTADLLLHIVQCWCACEVNEENQALHMVIYCSHTIYTDYSGLKLSPIKHIS